MYDVTRTRKPAHDIEDYIPADKCLNGYMYQIAARNGRFGIHWNGEFHLSRHKFGQNFLDREKHWDLCDHHGTVKPLLKLDPVDGFDPDDPFPGQHDLILKLLNQYEKELKKELEDMR